MIRRAHVSIAGLMGMVLVAAIGLTALHSASRTWAGTMFLLTCGVLALAIVGAACRGAGERAWWLGFALFGWGYLALAYRDADGVPRLPTIALLAALKGEAIPPPRAWGPSGGMMGGFCMMGGVVADPAYWDIGHCLCGLLAATLGGMLSRALFAGAARAAVGTGTDDRDNEAKGAVEMTSKGWRRPAVARVLAVLGPLASLGLAGSSRSSPELLVGVAFLWTWILLGFAALGAACCRGRRRSRWLGASLLGLGYMILIFGGDPHLPTSPRGVTDHLLAALRPRLPLIARQFLGGWGNLAAADACVLEALDQPVAMPFPVETPLAEVLLYIRAATYRPGGRGLQIYVDPVGLQEAEKTLHSPVQIDLEGMPLSTTLRLALKQLGLTYRVRDGLLFITCESSEDPTGEEEPDLVVGHCLLALLAAGLGGLFAPLVSAPRGEEST